MATTTIHFNGTREQAREIALSLGGILSGRTEGPPGVAEGFGNALGFAALSDIKSAFVVKARGGTDEMGIKWAPLHPSTIAGRRIGNPGSFKGTSDPSLIREREKIRRRETKRAFKKLQPDFSDDEAAKRARIIGGMEATRLTGVTKTFTLGGRSVEILRDIGILLNSLSPGTLAAGKYQKPTGEGGEQQVFDVQPGSTTVGTNVTYAGVHQGGSKKKNIPARPFLPDENHPVPRKWWNRWLKVGSKAVLQVAITVFERGPR